MTESLLSRLQSLTGLDREIDVEVYRALVEPLAEPFKEYAGSVWTGIKSSVRVPRYTASIDAALTLVPEGWAWAMRNAPPFAKVNGVEALGATPAIALLIAIMRAREGKEETND